AAAARHVEQVGAVLPSGADRDVLPQVEPAEQLAAGEFEHLYLAVERGNIHPRPDDDGLTEALGSELMLPDLRARLHYAGCQRLRVRRENKDQFRGAATLAQ